MCGIVGIYLKTKKYEKHLGKFLSGMLDGMATRGPDSAGFAVYTKENKKNLLLTLEQFALFRLLQRNQQHIKLVLNPSRLPIRETQRVRISPRASPPTLAIFSLLDKLLQLQRAQS